MKKTIRSSGRRFIAIYRETTRRGEVLAVRHDIYSITDKGRALIGFVRGGSFYFCTEDYVVMTDPVYFDELKALVMAVCNEYSNNQTTQQ